MHSIEQHACYGLFPCTANEVMQNLWRNKEELSELDKKWQQEGKFLVLPFI